MAEQHPIPLYLVNPDPLNRRAPRDRNPVNHRNAVSPILKRDTINPESRHRYGRSGMGVLSRSLLR